MDVFNIFYDFMEASIHMIGIGNITPGARMGVCEFNRG